MDTRLTAAAVNRACLQTIFKSDAVLCRHLERVHPQLIGGSDAPYFVGDDPEEFRLFLECPTDTIAYYLDMHLRKWMAALQRTIPAVEIWIEGPEYGVILSLSTIQMLDLERNISVESMISSTVERPTELTVEQQNSSAPASEIFTQPNEQSILYLKDFAEGINQPEAEIVKIMGTMRLPAFAQPDGTWGINEDDAYLIIRHRVKKIVEQRLNSSSEVAVEQSTSSTAPSGRRKRTAKAGMEAEEQSGTQSGSLIQWKTNPNQSSIKDTAEDTLTAIIKKIVNYNEMQICQALVRETDIGQELMAKLQPLFNKKNPNGKVNQFFNRLKEAASKRLKAMGLEVEVAAA